MTTAKANAIDNQLLIFPNEHKKRNRNYFYKTRLTGMKSKQEIKEDRRLLFNQMTDHIMQKGWSLKEVAESMTSNPEDAEKMYKRIRTIRSSKKPYLAPYEKEIDIIKELFESDLADFIPEGEEKVQNELNLSLQQFRDLQEQVENARKELNLEFNEKILRENERMKKKLEELSNKLKNK